MDEEFKQFQSTPSGWRVTGYNGTYSTAITIFQSTPSGWRVTGEAVNYTYNNMISIHTLRVEGDAAKSMATDVPAYFNPHPPGGG